MTADQPFKLRPGVIRKRIEGLAPTDTLQSEPEGEDDGTWYFDIAGAPASTIEVAPYKVGDKFVVTSVRAECGEHGTGPYEWVVRIEPEK